MEKSGGSRKFLPGKSNADVKSGSIIDGIEYQGEKPPVLGM